MAIDNVKKFEKDFEENEELREKEFEVLKDCGKDKKLILEITRKLGYVFTDDESKENLSKAKQLTDAEIE